MSPRRVNLVLFDVDGTLIDSNAAHALAWTRALREHGAAVEIEQTRSLIGVGGDKLLPRLANVEATSPKGRAIAARKKALFDELLPSLAPTRGARALIEHVRSRHLEVATATSAGDDELNALLERAGVADLFAMRTSKDDAAESKPDPDIVIAALHKANIDPSCALMVGDTPYDVEAAARAGVECVALRCGGHWPDAALGGAVAIYDDPQALLTSLDRHVAPHQQ